MAQTQRSKSVKINVPELNDSVIGWIYNTSRRYVYRVNKWYDFEDLVQDGLMIALKCRARYGYEIDPPHFTALVKTSFTNHLVSLQRKTNYNNELYIAELEDVKTGEEIDNILDTLYELPEQEFACTLNELPEPIKAVLRLFLSVDTLRKMRLPLRETLSDSETPAKRLKRLAGWPENRDFENELEKLLFPG
jgi:hypothetical protein